MSTVKEQKEIRASQLKELGDKHNELVEKANGITQELKNNEATIIRVQGALEQLHVLEPDEEVPATPDSPEKEGAEVSV